MSIGRGCIVFLLLLFVQGVMGQEYSFARYDLKDGLAGSTVYTMAQDKDGFLWFGTETGLSRFDGSRFVNFSTENGLPDNEILNLFADRKGRIWIAPFKVSLCYYFKGKIYTAENDSILSKIQLKGNVFRIAEDRNGTVLLQETEALHEIDSNGRVRTITSIHNKAGSFYNIGERKEGGFWVYANDTLFSYDKNGFVANTYLGNISAHVAFSVFSKEYYAWRSSLYGLTISSFSSKATINSPFNLDVVKMVSLNDSLVGICKKAGLWVYDIRNRKLEAVYLKDNSIAYGMIDKEGNRWFCSMGQGVFKLNSDFINNISLRDSGNRALGVYSITTHNNGLFLGTDLGSIYDFRLEGNKPFVKEKWVSNNPDDQSPIAGLVYDKTRGLYVGSGALFRLYDDKGWMKQSVTVISVKKLFAEDEQNFLVATHSHVLRINKDDILKRDTLWRSRSTAVAKFNDTVYIGSLEGLFQYCPDGRIIDLGKRYPVLKNRISSLVVAPDSVLWVGTYGGGIASLKNGQLQRVISQSNGLSSNICKTIYAGKGYVWVGTDKGAIKIYFKDTAIVLRKFSEADGLLSDNVNVIYEMGDKVYIGTSKGLTYFVNDEQVYGSTCDLKMTAFLANGVPYSIEQDNNFPHSCNNIQFEFVAISFRSIGDIIYDYRLIGSDTTWHSTRQNVLNYPSLPSGDYEFQLVATNKFGKRSDLVSVRFSISPLLWERVWFRALVIGLFLLIAILISGLIIRRINRREQEKLHVSRKITELEQLALKSQMNPHFIFNSLNSIQQYVMDKDIAGANKFIAGFSKLIRQTLDYSAKSRISLEEELDYLQNYLELEKTRLEGAFDYQFQIEPEVKNNEFAIPPMILQPFLENSVRHGVRNRKDNKGLILVKVSKDNRNLFFVIEDNGVGRKNSADMKSNLSVEYQSKGMSLTANRVDLMNRNSRHKLEVTIEDADVTDKQYPGTRIVLIIPVDFE